MKHTSEFALIERYFHSLTESRNDVIVGIGDDCAVLKTPDNTLMAISIDTLVENVHFFAGVDPYRLGMKALAVNLSDLAAMGARPAWFTLALTLPEIKSDWLDRFSGGLAEMAKLHQLQLVGGDTTRGPLTITIQVHGHLSEHDVLRRDAAQSGDLICVTGSLGDAAAGLQYQQGQLDTQWLTEVDIDYLVQRLEQPTPRNGIGEYLVGMAHAAIDISDGLLADLSHILDASKKGAKLNLSALPLSFALQKLPVEISTTLALTGGDDYELCFTLPVDQLEKVQQQFPGMIHVIGEITEESDRIFFDGMGQRRTFSELKAGYDHFAE